MTRGIMKMRIGVRMTVFAMAAVTMSSIAWLGAQRGGGGGPVALHPDDIGGGGARAEGPGGGGGGVAGAHALPHEVDPHGVDHRSGPHVLPPSAWAPEQSVFGRDRP